MFNKIKKFFTVEDNPNEKPIIYDTKKDDGINGFVVLILIVSIIRNVISLINNVLGIIGNGLLGDVTVRWYGAINSFLTIIALILILSKKKVGVILFFVLLLLNVLVLPTISHTGYFDCLIYSLIAAAIMTGLLFIRSNGRTAWDVILNGTNTDDNNEENINGSNEN